MNKSFVLISVLPETRDKLRKISSKKDTNIYKIVRDFANEEIKKILSNNNTCVYGRNNINKSKGSKQP